MKKLGLFTAVFIVVYLGLQITSGMIVTALYTPNTDTAWETVPTLTSEITMIGMNFTMATFIIILLALVISIGVTKLIQKKQATS